MSEKYGMKQTGSGGMSGATQTPANAHLGQDKPKAFDAAGAIGKQFTGTFFLHPDRKHPRAAC